MQTVRFGVIGVGHMGSYHARLLQQGQVERAELAAVCDIDPARLEQFPALRRFTDSRELIRSGAVDAVLIATPHYDHTTIGIDALQQGLHVLVEKPISVHKADCERLIAAHTNPKQVFAAMFNQRTDPFHRKIRELIRSGALGRLYRMSWTVTDWFRTEAYYASSEWRATWAGEGGGVLLNQAAHNLDLWQWWFGLPQRVEARCGFGRHHNIEVEDDVTAVLDYAHGVVGLFVTSTGEAPGSNRLEIAGSGGRVVYEDGVLRFTQNLVSSDRFSQQARRCYERPPSVEQEFRFPDHGGQHLAILNNFVAAILDGAALIAPAEEGIGAVELANAMIWSAARGEAVTLPLDAAGYEQYLHERIRSSSYRKKRISKEHDETAPYLVKE